MTINIPDNYKLLKREYSVHPVEFYRIQLGFIIPEINNTKLTILAYIAAYGYPEGRDQILIDNIVTSKSSLHNFVSEMRTKGIIEGYGDQTKLVDEIMLCNEDHITLLTLRKDSNKNEIGHRYFKTK